MTFVVFFTCANLVELQVPGAADHHCRRGRDDQHWLAQRLRRSRHSGNMRSSPHPALHIVIRMRLSAVIHFSLLRRQAHRRGRCPQRAGNLHSWPACALASSLRVDAVPLLPFQTAGDAGVNSHRFAAAAAGPGRRS